MDSEIVEAQRQLGQALDLDRSILGQLEGDEGLVITHSWYRPGLEAYRGSQSKICRGWRAS
jgi:hypothetical protein